MPLIECLARHRPPHSVGATLVCNQRPPSLFSPPHPLCDTSSRVDPLLGLPLHDLRASRPLLKIPTQPGCTIRRSRAQHSLPRARYIEPQSAEL